MLTDGDDHRCRSASAQDHKRVGDGDTGPNTGGMGAYSPARVLTPDAGGARARARSSRPTVDGDGARRARRSSGVLYAGLMLTARRAQADRIQRPLRRSRMPGADAAASRATCSRLLLAVARGAARRAAARRDFADDAALTVVMAANGYPGTPETGGAIGGIDAAEATGAIVFQAGTRASGGRAGRERRARARGHRDRRRRRRGAGGRLSRGRPRSTSPTASAAATSAGARSRARLGSEVGAAKASRRAGWRALRCRHERHRRDFAIRR